MYSFLFSVAVLVDSSNVEEEECTLHRLHACLQSLQSISQGSDLALAATHEELMTVCKWVLSPPIFYLIKIRSPYIKHLSVSSKLIITIKIITLLRLLKAIIMWLISMFSVTSYETTLLSKI